MPFGKFDDALGRTAGVVHAEDDNSRPGELLRLRIHFVELGGGRTAMESPEFEYEDLSREGWSRRFSVGIQPLRNLQFGDRVAGFQDGRGMRGATIPVADDVGNRRLQDTGAGLPSSLSLLAGEPAVIEDVRPRRRRSHKRLR